MDNTSLIISQFKEAIALNTSPWTCVLNVSNNCPIFYGSHYPLSFSFVLVPWREIEKIMKLVAKLRGFQRFHLLSLGAIVSNKIIFFRRGERRVHKHLFSIYIATCANCLVKFFLVCWNYHPNTTALILAVFKSHYVARKSLGFASTFFFVTAFFFTASEIWCANFVRIPTPTVAHRNSFILARRVASTVSFVIWIS